MVPHATSATENTTPSHSLQRLCLGCPRAADATNDSFYDRFQNKLVVIAGALISRTGWAMHSMKKLKDSSRLVIAVEMVTVWLTLPPDNLKYTIPASKATPGNFFLQRRSDD